MKNERYYYSLLTREERQIYQRIYEGIRRHDRSIPLSTGVSRERLTDIYRDVLYDTPLFFYIDQSISRTSGGPGSYTLLPIYLYTDRESELLLQDIRRVLLKIDRKARNLVSKQFRLEKYLHNSIVKSVRYDFDALKQEKCPAAHSIVGAFLDNKAVCEGIAKAFKLLCNMYSIKCIVVLGMANPGGRLDQEGYHAWNLVKIEDGSYHVDVTWDNMLWDETGHISYDYFNVTTEDIRRDHRPEGRLPLCTDSQLNYFHFTKSFVHTREELTDLIDQRFNAREILFKVPPGSPDFPTMDAVREKTNLALTEIMRRRMASKRGLMVFNDAQWIGKILFL